MGILSLDGDRMDICLNSGFTSYADASLNVGPQRPRAFFAERNSHFTYHTLNRDSELTAEYDRAVQKTALPDDPAVLAALHDSTRNMK